MTRPYMEEQPDGEWVRSARNYAFEIDPFDMELVKMQKQMLCALEDAVAHNCEQEPLCAEISTMRFPLIFLGGVRLECMRDMQDKKLVMRLWDKECSLRRTIVLCSGRQATLTDYMRRSGQDGWFGQAKMHALWFNELLRVAHAEKLGADTPERELITGSLRVGVYELLAMARQKFDAAQMDALQDNDGFGDSLFVSVPVEGVFHDNMVYVRLMLKKYSGRWELYLSVIPDGAGYHCVTMLCWGQLDDIQIYLRRPDVAVLANKANQLYSDLTCDSQYF